MADPEWFAKYSDILIPELSESVVMAGLIVDPSGNAEESMSMSNYFGDYDIIVAVAINTAIPNLRAKPSSFSWADTWWS